MTWSALLPRTPVRNLVTMPSPTARDAAAARRLWNDRVLSDADVDRALAELAELVGQRDRAGQIVRRLAEVWPRDVLRRAEAFLDETEDPAVRRQRERRQER